MRYLLLLMIVAAQTATPASHVCRNYDQGAEKSTGCACEVVCDEKGVHEDVKCQHWCDMKQCACHSPKCP